MERRTQVEICFLDEMPRSCHFLRTLTVELAAIAIYPDDSTCIGFGCTIIVSRSSSE